MSHQIVLERPIQEVLVDWQEKCKDNAWMHDQSAKYFRNMNTLFMVPIIVLSTIAGTINIASAASNACDEEPGILNHVSHGVAYVPLVLGFMGLSSAILSGVYNFLKIGETRIAHVEAGGAFDKLAREIRVEGLLQDVLEGTYASQGTLLKEIQEKIDNVSEKAPSIPGFVERRLKRNKAST